jgi:PAS domain S-box-containing protein
MRPSVVVARPHSVRPEAARRGVRLLPSRPLHTPPLPEAPPAPFAALRRAATCLAAAVVATAFALLAGLAAAPLQASALPLIQSYTPGGHPQYWAVAQDPRGVLYFGSGDGVLEHAGGGWRLYVLPRRGTVRSLAAANDSSLYVGSQGDFGYLELTADGNRSYVSLLGHVPPDDRAFGDVWKTWVLPDGVYFQANARLFRWAGGQIRVWRPQGSYHFSHFVDGVLYVLEQERGLLRLDGETLVPVPGGRQLAGDRLYAMLPLGGGRTLVATRRQGLFAMTSGGIEPFAAAAAPYLAEHQIYHGTVLPDGSFALGTLTGGVAIVAPDGALVQVLDKSSGLRSNKVAFTFVDREQALWVAQEGAVARIEVRSPLKVFALPEGEDAAVLAVEQVGDLLYVGTSMGLHRLGLAVAPTAAVLEPVPGIEAQVLHLSAAGDGVVAATQAGVYYVRGDELLQVAPGISNASQASLRQPGRYWIGQTDGVRAIERDGAGWRDLGLIAGVSADVRTVFERPDGGLWIGSKAHGLFRADPPPPGQLPVARAVAGRGLPEEGSVDVWVYHGRPVFLSDRGIHEWNEARDSFPLVSWSAALVAGRRPVLLESDFLGRTWLSLSPGPGGSRTGDELVFLSGDPPRPSPLAPLAQRMSGWAALRVLTDSSGITWFGTRRGLVRLDAAVGPPPLPKTYLPLCDLEGERPETAGGHGAGVRQRGRSLRVECGLPAYFVGVENQFRFALGDLDEEWSRWQTGGSRLYAGLPFGQHTLRVQARDGYGRDSAVLRIPLEIVAPWYHTLPAYLGALLLGTGALWSGYRLRVRSLERRRRALEELVEERTRELRHSERNYRDLFENASDVIFALDQDGHIVSLNPAVEELGFEREALLGRPLEALVREEDRPKVRRWLGPRESVDVSPVEVTLVVGDIVRTVEVKVRPLGEPSVTRLEGVARDVSERRARLDAALSRARLRALQSQLQPHFLFNCLNGIAGLVGHDDERARQMLAELGDLLRFSLQDDSAQEVPLWQELAVLGKYVALQQSRFGNRLEVQVDTANGLSDLAVPRFVLQPLVENSIKHAVERVRRPVRVTVSLRRENGSLHLAVADDGPGFAATAQPGVGLANLRERLRALYGTKQSLEVRAPAGGGSEVEVVLPARPHTREKQVVPS